MKLEELRQRLREPKLARQAPNPPSREKKRKAGSKRDRGPGFGVALFVDDPHFDDDESSGPTLRAKCAKCRKMFKPDPKLGYVPRVCASCDSYL